METHAAADFPSLLHFPHVQSFSFQYRHFSVDGDRHVGAVFAPDWPRRLLHIPALERFQAKWTPVRAPWTPRAPDWRAGAFAACACIWLFSQTVIPLRHYLFKGDVAWTYEGHRFSWRMKLVDRWSPDPIAIIFVPQENLILSPPMRKILSPRQHNNVATHPRSARKFAQQIAGIISKTKGWSDIRVHLYFPVGYNNREAILLIDPRVNLVTAPTHLRPPPWIITHNDKPLRRIEQFSSQHAYPDIIQLAQMMNLPRPVDCITGADGWMVCTLERAQNLTQVR